jgi:hypothetical protein
MSFKCGICGHWNCYAGHFKHPTRLFASMPHPYILGKDCMFEHDLPDEMSDREYADWREESVLVDGVRMGPVFPPNARDHRAPEGRSGASTCWAGSGQELQP